MSSTLVSPAVDLLAMTIRLATILVAVVLIIASTAQAGSRYCTESGDYCAKVSTNGVIRFTLTSFAITGKYTLSVRSPDGKVDAKKFTLRRQKGGIFTSSVRWSKHFRHRGEGAYSINWELSQPLGTVLASLKFSVK